MFHALITDITFLKRPTKSLECRKVNLCCSNNRVVTVLSASSLTELNHNSLHVSSKYIIHSTIINVQQSFIFYILYLSIRYSFNCKFKHIYMNFLNCGLIPTPDNYNCILYMDYPYWCNIHNFIKIL
jgi:hypothetical protein